MTRPKKDDDTDKHKDNERQIRLENTFRERPKRLLIFETFDQSDQKTWPDQKKDNDKDKTKTKTNAFRNTFEERS